MTFGNRSFVLHLTRGILGFGALALAMRGYEVVGWPALLLLIVAVWALKGCPICWTIGLIETAAQKILANAESVGSEAPESRAASSAP